MPAAKAAAALLGALASARSAAHCARRVTRRQAGAPEFEASVEEEGVSCHGLLEHGAGFGRSPSPEQGSAEVATRLEEVGVALHRFAEALLGRIRAALGEIEPAAREERQRVRARCREERRDDGRRVCRASRGELGERHPSSRLGQHLAAAARALELHARLFRLPEREARDAAVQAEGAGGGGLALREELSVSAAPEL